MSSVTDFSEQLLVLRHGAGLADHAALDEAMMLAVLEGAGSFARGPWGEIEQVGDTMGVGFADGVVTMPPGFPDAYRDYVAAGWGTVGVDEAYGGQGLPYPLAMAVIETLGRANFALTGCVTLTAGAIEALVQHGTDRQRALYLPRLATGEWNGTMNLTEPQAGSDVGALRATATPRGDGTWAIRGTKIFITFGDHDMTANVVHLVLARTPGAPAGTRGISLFLVPKYRIGPDGAPGEDNHVRVASIEHKLGFHASPTCVMVFGEDGDCIGELIGEECGGGMRCMFTMMNSARIAVGLQGVQIGEGATRKAVAYARDRVQGMRKGQAAAIIDHPDVRRMLMRMKALTQGARALIFYAAGCLERAGAGAAGDRQRLELLTPIVKTYGSEIGVEVADLGIQVHGGMGYIEETGATRYWRDARITPIYEGTSGIQAADLAGRKLALDGGAAFTRLIGDMRADAVSDHLKGLIADCEAAGLHIAASSGDDRLAPSYPFLRMLAVAVAAWQLERQLAHLDDGPFGDEKRAVVRFYLNHLVPEASGLKAAAMAPASDLYDVGADAF